MELFKQKNKIDENELANVVVDIDAIDVKPTYFKWNDRAHKLKPVTTKQFFIVTQALAKLDALGKKKDFTSKELVEAYGALIESTCDTIKKDEVLNMTQAQVGALFQLIIQHVTGRAQVKDSEKKT